MELTHVFGLASIVFLLAAIYVLRSGDKDEAPVVKKRQKREAPNGRVQIYFGSQTGTAEGYAKTIADEANRRGFDAEVIDLEDFDDDHMTVRRPASVFICVIDVVFQREGARWSFFRFRVPNERRRLSSSSPWPRTARASRRTTRINSSTG